MRTHGEGTQKEKKEYGKRNEMYNSRQTEYNVQQAGELHNKSGVGGKKQKCIEAGRENAEVGGGSDIRRQIVPNFRAGDRDARLLIKEQVLGTMTMTRPDDAERKTGCPVWDSRTKPCRYDRGRPLIER